MVKSESEVIRTESLNLKLELNQIGLKLSQVVESRKANLKTRKGAINKEYQMAEKGFINKSN